MADLVQDASRPPASTDDEVSRPSSPVSRKKRSSYIPQACINCRKRKVKCSGDPTCAECSKAGEPCFYTERRRKRRSDKHHSPRPERRNPFDDQTATVELSDHVISMSSRLSDLERHYSRLRNAMATSRKSVGETNTDSHNVGPGRTVPGHPISNEPQQTQESAPQDDFSRLPVDDTVEAAPNRSGSVQAELAPRPTNDLSQQEKSPPPQQATHDPGETDILEGFLPPGPSPDMIRDADPSQLVREIRINNGASFRSSFDIFFRHLNPLHPLINENMFRSQFDNFVFDQGGNMSEVDQSLFLSLVNLIHAEVVILTGDCLDSQTILGWREFCAADSILQDLVWKGQGTIMTIQCLLLKTRYLMYLERTNQAYDTMAIAARICMQIGLHDQSRWAAQGIDPFETNMRQRVFYSLFTLEQAVALTCRLPPALRRSDFNVETPQALDDRSMFPNRPLPEVTPELSFIPYLLAMIKWAELCGEIWDTMLSVKAQKPVSQAQIDALDAKILDHVHALPPQLQWRHEDSNTNRHRVEPYLWRQRIMYHVRMNSMRLRIRQENRARLSFGSNMADEVVKIARDTINILKVSLRSSADPTHRYFSCMYLVGVITPLSRVIVMDNTLPVLRAEAIASWKEALQLLQEISCDFDLARQLLQRSHGVIKAANLIVSAQGTGSNFDGGHPTFPEIQQEVGDGDAVGQLRMQDMIGVAVVRGPNEHQQTHFPLSHLPTPVPGNDHAFLDGATFDADWWMGMTW